MAALEQIFDSVSWARPTTLACEQVLALPSTLAGLLPGGGLRRGSVVTAEGVHTASGATTLAFGLAAAATAAGGWAALVGLPEAGLVAASELGLALERLALVPHVEPERWPVVTAVLVDAVDIVVARPPSTLRRGDARRLAARLRERGSVLVVTGADWPEPVDTRLQAASAHWGGLGHGCGRLQGRLAEVVAGGRGASGREKRTRLQLPAPDGTVTTHSQVALVPPTALGEEHDAHGAQATPRSTGPTRPTRPTTATG